MKNNKQGISLIVLSITILVMAILAATAIIALEDSGIIGRSKNTVGKQNYIQEYERLQVIKNGILTDNFGEITVDEYITELTNKGLIESGVTTNSDGSKSVTTKTGFIANIIQDGESNLIISLGEANSTITLSPVTLTGDITSGAVTKTITATTTNVTGDITWASSNSSVASVTGTNSSATVTMKNIGTATITATYGNAKASCSVTVTGTVATPTITLDKTTLSKTIDSGSTATETITATTQNISGTLIWSSSNTSVATISASGNTATVTMKAGGTATITATITATYGSTSASCTVVVTENEVATYTLSGVWTFNDTLTQTGWASGTAIKHESVNFYRVVDGETSSGESTSFDYYPEGTMAAVFGTSQTENCSTILFNNTRLYMLYHFGTCEYASAPCITPGTVNESYKTIDFGSTSQTVSEEFYNWFTANATQRTTVNNVTRKIYFVEGSYQMTADENATWEEIVGSDGITIYDTQGITWNFYISGDYIEVSSPDSAAPAGTITGAKVLITDTFGSASEYYYNESDGYLYGP